MSDQSLREHLLYLIQGGGAHLNFDQAIGEFPIDLRGERAPGFDHTGWQLVEHMRICQWDILEFSRNPNHVSPEFPDGYWPDSNAPENNLAWDNCVAQFRNDLNEMIALILDPTTDLFEPIPHGEGQTILREALLIADHNAYHLGQLVSLRKCLGAWSD